jgi:hypothetical protein
MRRVDLPDLVYNWISGIGAVLAGTSFLAAVLLLLLGVFSLVRGPYIGIVTYIFLPGVVALGLVLLVLGMWRKSRWLRAHEPGERPPWPRIDLNRQSTRNGAMLFVFGSTVFVLTSIVGVYRAFLYADSVPFCGKLCHTVMRPEYATHAISPHAIVACSGCHGGTEP